ncbi:helix-turn-helix transcriptional regulator [Methylomonas sp. SURF-1]|uniref:Helix-turn-helix transcriptional regulator n=1 Tax=Methylomonas aurea TaxID=2952224 RepID=A0ABT1UIQ2_9GAMM|nr:helix-turn-helix transcriptional regulator [Methylomonas sp. SURF-1]MCQ8181296.1 helix-turn-helix transcriptional regulator [Methylomonas sp. SURF-1]
MTNRPKRDDALLASLQQLCSLGLASETVMPDLLKGLSRWMGCDNGQFVWVDAQQRPCNFYCDAGDASIWQNYLSIFDQLGIPGWKTLDWYQQSERATVVGGRHDQGYYRSSFYGEIMHAVGGECSICIPIRDSGGLVRGSIGLNRQTSVHAFNDADRLDYEQFASHLSLLFSNCIEPEASNFQRIGERGIAVFDYAGKLLYSDDPGRQLLFLTGYPKIRRLDHNANTPGVEINIRRICSSLQSIARGKPAQAPAFEWVTAWGRIGFRGRLLSSTTENNGGTIGMDIVRYIPRRIAFWRQISSLDLPLRQRQVCLEFVENRSLTDIAKRLGISRNTVIDHVNKLYDRFGLEPSRENLQEFLSQLRSPDRYALDFTEPQ